MRQRPLATLAFLLLVSASPALAEVATAGNPPSGVIANPPAGSVAVLDFSTRGLTSTWWGAWEPGVALSDLVTSALVNAGYNVVDRTHLEQVMKEHALSSAGEVSDASLVSSGRLTGAKFLIVGNILQFAHTGSSGGGAGALLPGFVGALASGIRSDRVTLKVEVRIIDAVTGRILQSFSDEKTQSGTSWGAAGFAGTAAGGYGNSSFVNSTMGHLINDEALAVVKNLNPDRMQSAPAKIASGHVLAVEGPAVVVNLGSGKIAVGDILEVVLVRSVKDPDSGKMISAALPTGKISITSVSESSSAGRLISGKAAAGSAVRIAQ